MNRLRLGQLLEITIPSLAGLIDDSDEDIDALEFAGVLAKYFEDKEVCAEDLLERFKFINEYLGLTARTKRT